MKISRRRRHLRPRASRAQIRQNIDRLRGQLQWLQLECLLELARPDRDLSQLHRLNDHILDRRDSLEFWESC
jgi:hypothetical protein